MIPRYSRRKMVEIWEPANKFKMRFEIEAHACDAGKGETNPTPRRGLIVLTKLSEQHTTMSSPS